MPKKSKRNRQTGTINYVKAEILRSGRRFARHDGSMYAQGFKGMIVRAF